MACDEGRVRGVLRWVLVDGRGDDEFRRHQRDAQAGAAAGQTATLQGALTEILDHDHGSRDATRECERERPGCLVAWGREILGLKAMSEEEKRAIPVAPKWSPR